MIYIFKLALFGLFSVAISSVMVAADSFTAQFRPNGEGPFQTAATGALPEPGNELISIQCYNGPPDREHWIRFDNFRILKLEE